MPDRVSVAAFAVRIANAAYKISIGPPSLFFCSTLTGMPLSKFNATYE